MKSFCDVFCICISNPFGHFNDHPRLHVYNLKLFHVLKYLTIFHKMLVSLNYQSALAWFGLVVR